MIWNTIAHPKMMDQIGDLRSLSPIKFADTHKLSFYDIIVCATGDQQYILVKGDFETIKKMLLNDEAICGAVFESVVGNDVKHQTKTEITRFLNDSVADRIILDQMSGDPLYLLSDNTISK